VKSTLHVYLNSQSCNLSKICVVQLKLAKIQVDHHNFGREQWDQMGKKLSKPSDESSGAVSKVQLTEDAALTASDPAPSSGAVKEEGNGEGISPSSKNMNALELGINDVPLQETYTHVKGKALKVDDFELLKVLGKVWRAFRFHVHR